MTKTFGSSLLMTALGAKLRQTMVAVATSFGNLA
jgi:hypothetical protein